MNTLIYFIFMYLTSQLHSNIRVNMCNVQIYTAFRLEFTVRSNPPTVQLISYKFHIVHSEHCKLIYSQYQHQQKHNSICYRLYY
jgi:hypothetical protein